MLMGIPCVHTLKFYFLLLIRCASFEPLDQPPGELVGVRGLLVQTKRPGRQLARASGLRAPLATDSLRSQKPGEAQGGGQSEVVDRQRAHSRSEGYRGGRRLLFNRRNSNPA